VNARAACGSRVQSQSRGLSSLLWRPVLSYWLEQRGVRACLASLSPGRTTPLSGACLAKLANRPSQFLLSLCARLAGAAPTECQILNVMRGRLSRDLRAAISSSIPPTHVAATRHRVWPACFSHHVGRSRACISGSIRLEFLPLQPRCCRDALPILDAPCGRVYAYGMRGMYVQIQV